MEGLKLDGRMLKPMSTLLETKIHDLMMEVLKNNKIGEITLKLELATIEREKVVDGEVLLDTWLEPIINYQLTEKLRETKATRKGGLGQGYEIKADDLLDDIYIQEVM